MKFFVYILQCSDASLYTGITNDLEERIQKHNEGKTGAKYTRSRRPVRLVYSETAANMSAALRREAEIKRMKRTEKLKLIKKNLT